jgi:GAF domain-containing protein
MVPAAGNWDVAPWADWTSAVDGALEFLHARVGWDVWTLTHVDGERQIVLRDWPHGVVTPGTSFDWESSFCRRMVSGAGPRVATVAAAVPAYAALTAGERREVAAYLGVPIVTTDGDLFGTLCAVSFRARPLRAAADLPVVEMVARMLSTLMAAQQRDPTALAEDLLARPV